MKTVTSSGLELKFDSWVYARLAEPFDPEELSFRPGGGASILAYLDARKVAERLNFVVGAENWTDSYTPISVKETVVLSLDEEGRAVPRPKYGEAYVKQTYPQYYEGIKCDLGVLGLYKSDVGTLSNVDQLKGAASDALKRAAVKFGIGAYLYDLKELRGRIVDKKVVGIPELPEFALPVERNNPKDAVLRLAEKVKSLDLSTSDRLKLENVMSEVMVMGNYNDATPLVVVRAVYEELGRLSNEQ